MSEVTKQIVIEALNQVEDPELMMGIVDIGLVYEVNVDEENNVAMTYSLTSMGCPAGPHIASEIERAITEVPGVKGVKAELVWSPPWTPELMSEDAKFALGF
ncbi:MAG: metal-sulfur cluster assembly factor [Actinobacteria bacterium]|nr:metal-sulfur cluster assembly factor [Actinomycetota bacterium]